ncbi:MAG: hypothetical protein LUE98_05160 [Tannerellaceae bacterium]|nr:hypothetical protein [Tannerellaceae bacterium]
MNKLYSKYILLFWVILSLNGNAVSYNQYKGKIKNMKTIQFLPKEFNEIKLGYYENEMSVCSPGYPDDTVEINTLLINIPHTIISKDRKSCTPVIPLCITSGLSDKRYYKYYNLSAKIIYVKKEGEEVIYSGQIVEQISTEWDVLNEFPPDMEDFIKEEETNIAEAQLYSDEELNEGTYSPRHANLNLLDYVDMPFLPGKYEVWVTFSGLESNHMFVEIIRE